MNPIFKISIQLFDFVFLCFQLSVQLPHFYHQRKKGYYSEKDQSIRDDDQAAVNSREYYTRFECSFALVLSEVVYSF